MSYDERKSEIVTYFDRTAVQAWERLTSTAPVGHIRATVRAGRDRMRNTLLSWLPEDLQGARILDAGCGTGALAVEAARRGADVVAIDLSPTLVDLAIRRVAEQHGSGTALNGGRLDFRSGDMLDASLGRFDHIVAMDSLIHYRSEDAVRLIDNLAQRCNRSLLFTFAPSTPLLAAMHAVGRFFPRGDRSPSIEPVKEIALQRAIKNATNLAAWRIERSERIASGFYTSQAMELKLA
jgi:magnesium-protoporphyrin O-methyltransferase